MYEPIRIKSRPSNTCCFSLLVLFLCFHVLSASHHELVVWLFLGFCLFVLVDINMFYAFGLSIYGYGLFVSYQCLFSIPVYIILQMCEIFIDICVFKVFVQIR